MSATTIIVNDVEPRRQYTATASQTVFDFPIPFFAEGDLSVWLTPTGQTADDTADLLTITTEYTVTGANTQDGGQITLVTPATAGDIITIERVVDIARLSDFQNSGDLLAETLNKEQDTEIFISQQLRQDINRSLRLPSSGTITDGSLPAAEALKFLRVNAAGDGFEYAEGTTSAVAADVAFTPAGDVAATDVQAAIEELDTEKQAASANIPTVVVSQAEAEAGTSTDNRTWTPERVSQAIAALAVQPTTGNFTPTLLDSSKSTGEGQTYTVQTGHYTKIGNKVFCEGRIVMSSLGSLTGTDNAFIGGLPFTAANDISKRGTITVGFADNLSITAGNSITGLVTHNSNDCSLRLFSAATGTAQFLINNLTATSELYFSIEYTAA